MAVNRRNFIRVSIGSAASAALVAGMTSCEKKSGASSGSPVDALQSMTQDIVPISVKERESRVEKAQRLMAENKIEALVIDAGTTLTYFTGVQWWPSERTMVAIIPAKGDVKYVCPAFEEERLRQLITLGKEVRVWQEHESPYAEIAKGF